MLNNYLFYFCLYRYLELQSSGRRNEVRFHFTYITPTNDTIVHTETFPYRLADNKWHKVSLSVSGSEIQLLIDCHPLYRRVSHFIPDRNFSASNYKLFVGQKNFESHSMFKVWLFLSFSYIIIIVVWIKMKIFEHFLFKRFYFRVNYKMFELYQDLMDIYHNVHI